MFGSKVLLTIAVMFLFIASLSVSAQVSDRDYDGVPDQEETSFYFTNPENPDSDNDGVLDGTEVSEGTDPLDEKSSMLARAEMRFMYTWYLGRASGIVAFVLFSVVVIYGLLMSTTLSAKLGIASSYETHRFLTWIALVSTVVHFSSFLFDDFLQMKVVEVFVPFLFSREFSSVAGYDLAFPVAFGVIALYLGILVALTAEFRVKIAPKAWRKIHYAGFVFYLLMVLHGFFAGSDSKEWWMQALYIVSLSLVCFLVLLRIASRPKTPTENTEKKQE